LLSVSADAQESDTITFATFGDFGNGPGATAVADLVKGSNVDYIVTVGDNCYGYSPPLSEQVGAKYGDYVTTGRFIPSLGNHDYTNRCGNNGVKANPVGYLAYFDLPNNERYYTLRKGPVEFFVADSSMPLPDGRCRKSIQALWFKDQLAASTAPWKIVVFHKAAFASGSHGSFLCMQWPFEQWGADAVLAGHNHHYERVMRDDNADGRHLPYFVSGLGGQPADEIVTLVSGSVVQFNQDYGALFATASPTTLTFQFRSVGGVVVDTLSIAKQSTNQSQFDFKTPPKRR
jgi:hypothetical protein